MHVEDATINLEDIAKTLVKFLKSPASEKPDQSIKFILEYMKTEYKKRTEYGYAAAPYHIFVTSYRSFRGDTTTALKIKNFIDNLQKILDLCKESTDKIILDGSIINALNEMKVFFKSLTLESLAGRDLIHAVLTEMQIKITPEKLLTMLQEKSGKSFMDEFELVIAHAKRVESSTIEDRAVVAIAADGGEIESSALVPYDHDALQQQSNNFWGAVGSSIFHGVLGAFDAVGEAVENKISNICGEEQSSFGSEVDESNLDQSLSSDAGEEHDEPQARFSAGSPSLMY